MFDLSYKSNKSSITHCRLQQMSSPKFIRVYKSPKNNSGKNEQPKPVKKKCEKSKEPMDKQRKQKQELKYRLEEANHKIKHLESELNKERLKNQALDVQVKTLMEQFSRYKRENYEEKILTQRRLASIEKRQSNMRTPVTVSVFNEERETNLKKPMSPNSEQTHLVSHPVSPKQKIQVGGYFGSLFN